jgi:hypothetical protein
MASYCNAYMNIESYGKKPSFFSSLYYFYYHPHYIIEFQINFEYNKIMC